MTTIGNTPDEPRDEGSHSTDRRPLGMWLRLVDHLISREFAAAFDGESVTRRDWMALNAVAGTVDAALGTADRLARGGKHLARLAERGWITRDDNDAWALTDTGKAAFDRLSEKVGAVRAKVAGTLSDDDFTQLKTSLETMALGLGWDETQPLPRGGKGRGGKAHKRFGGRRGRRGAEGGFGPHGFDVRGVDPRAGFGEHGFGEHGLDPRARHTEGRFDPRARYAKGHLDPHARYAGGRFDRHAECEHGFGPGRRGIGPEHHAHLREEFERRHHRHAHRGDPRGAERAYERGFAAGFDAASTRGTASTPTTD